MNQKRKICVVTGARSEFGLLKWVMNEIKTSPDLQLQTIVTGMHLSPAFGLTYREIEEHGFSIDAKVEMLLASDSRVAVTKSLGLGVMGFAEAFDSLRPDVVLVLGDRFEILAAAQAALIAEIPLAHIHGGETTEGAIDESIRHAITKMAQWHFVAAEPYRKRVIQLGESPDSVFNVGAPGLDCLSKERWMTPAELTADLKIELRHPLFLVTYHPVTLGQVSPTAAMQELVEALEHFREATVVITYPNADPGNAEINRILDIFAKRNPERVKPFLSLGQRRYLSLMRECDVVIGNSSSALIEAPALKKAAVNLGSRQDGRLRASSLIDVPENRAEIIAAIERALSPEFQRGLADVQSLYGQGDAGLTIAKTLTGPLPALRKKFFNVTHMH